MPPKYLFYRELPKEWYAMEEEMLARLGVPAKGTPEREEWSYTQSEVWRPWMQAVSEHAWRFVEGPCLNCGQLTTVMETTSKRWHPMTLCIDCLNSGPSFYPTGWVMSDGKTYVRHSENCTSHSSFPTSSSSMHSEQESLQSLTQSSRTSNPTSTSSSPTTAQRTQTARTSSHATPSSPSASLRPMSLNFNTRRK